MNIDNLIVEIEQDFKQYKTAGLLDRASMYRWANTALKKFGQSICTMQEAVVQVKKGQAPLPEGFHSLHMAVKCSPKGYYCEEKSVPVLQNSLMWKERIERTKSWNSCEPCCTEECEKTIVENIYLNDAAISFYYESPVLLKLSKSIKKEICTSTCRNLAVRESPNEINIIGTTLQTNFSEGTVFLQYYGLELENGFPLIPETGRGELATYIEYYLKMRWLEVLLTNKDDPNINQLFTYYVQKEKQQFSLALSDAKFSTLTPSSYRKLAMSNRLNMLRHEILIPQL